MRERNFSTAINLPEFGAGPRAFERLWLVSYCLLVGGSERFILRSAAPFVKKIRSEKLRADLRKCFGQEANHATTHDALLDALEKKYPVLKFFLAAYRFVCFTLLEKLSPQGFRLAAAAAMEQLNTSLAIEGLKNSPVARAEGGLGAMLHWHFVEEIEHREAIFDLLVESRVSFFWRLPAALLVTISFWFWISAGALLLAILDWQPARLRGGLRVPLEMHRAALRFCRPDYHPREERLPEKFAEHAAAV